MDEQLLDELTRELLTPPPAPYQPPVETAAVKRRRLKELDRDLNPELYAAKPTPAELDYMAGLRGRICDLPADYLDMLASRRPATAEVRSAQKQISQSEVPRQRATTQGESERG